MKLEVCVDSLESALAAQSGGADRIELCSNLSIGGTTPTMGLIEIVRKNIDIDVYVMIRPRGGDFCYSDYEYMVMKKDIDYVKKLGVNGIVTGILTPHGEVDIKRMEEIVKLAHPLKVTFHRAIDRSNDIFKAVEILIQLGIGRVLTSGGKQFAIDGVEVIKELIEKYGKQIKIMPGSGINEINVNEIIRKTNAEEVHFSGKVFQKSKMIYKNIDVNPAEQITISDAHNLVCSSKRVKRMKEILSEFE